MWSLTLDRFLSVASIIMFVQEKWNNHHSLSSVLYREDNYQHFIFQKLSDIFLNVVQLRLWILWQIETREPTIVQCYIWPISSILVISLSHIICVLSLKWKYTYTRCCIILTLKLDFSLLVAFNKIFIVLNLL